MHCILDIGTRFIRGLLVERDASSADRVVVRHAEILEYDERAMLAGQIHDIERVTAAVARIKQSLEQKAGFPITRAACAVAGRNLYTVKGRNAVVRNSPLEPISPDEIRQLELSTVQKALETLDESAEYYCVGYSTTEYRRDGEVIKNLSDHRGREIGAEVLVTLLPYRVLESMFTVLQRSGLELSFLTLEPIAALESVVPRDLYHLNLVLVDIGAGTSDIAIIARGKVMAYGMVPMAGDSITEAFSSAYLMDFLEAERVKRRLGDALRSGGSCAPGENVSYTDIFGRNGQKPYGEMLETIRQPAGILARRIGEEIRTLLTVEEEVLRPGYAVVMVGGGSQTPFLEQEIATALDLPPERVGVRHARFACSTDETGMFQGPEASTGIGIALLACRQQGFSLLHLTINEARKTLINIGGKEINVLSALLANGITVRQIYGKPGLARTFTLNGQLRTVRGSMPLPAVIKVNGAEARLDTEIREGDQLSFSPAGNGRDAVPRVKDLMAEQTEKVVFNGKDVPLPARFLVNGEAAGPETEIPDRAELSASTERSLAALVRSLGYDDSSLRAAAMAIEVNGETLTRTLRNYRLSINGREREFLDAPTLNGGDRIELAIFEPKLRVKDLVADPGRGNDLRIRINGEEYSFPGGRGKVLLNGAEAGPDDTVSDGDSIRTSAGKDAEVILVDIFRYLHINPQDQAGKKLRLLINDSEANFTSPLFSDADVKVLFE